jgi:hypothetical protein
VDTIVDCLYLVLWQRHDCRALAYNPRRAVVMAEQRVALVPCCCWSCSTQYNACGDFVSMDALFYCSNAVWCAACGGVLMQYRQHS